MPEIRYFLGIDGGGTKTDFALANDDGNLLRRLQLGATNPNDVGFEKAFSVLREGILTLLEGIDPAEVSVFAGLAGCSSFENKPKIEQYLSSFGFGRAQNHNDAQNALAAALDGEDGIMVILGTGSIAYAQSGSSLHRIGGYGYLFGDAGSGFAIGRDVILAALQAEDGSGAPTVLCDLVKEKAGLKTVLAGIDDFYRGGKQLLASYAPLAFRAHQTGDEIAKKILWNNLSAIADLIDGGAKKLSEKQIKVALCGGLTKDEAVILPILSALLAGKNHTYTIEICRCAPVWGALRLAGMPKKETPKRNLAVATATKTPPLESATF